MISRLEDNLYYNQLVKFAYIYILNNIYEMCRVQMPCFSLGKFPRLYQKLNLVGDFSGYRVEGEKERE